ncbi:hypothetical protein AIOL_003665 [Candidatus Rhodobacter oscarellae]|uniref:Phosphodiester glycosidase domain-containing protein n=1 Tax=Candidatus Rhodobacter oscarellae TaxID=1675527 RepID=A0A0J9E7K9_9RHOB|nr:phosphodiester glycosidase family protein [Candidatus Rhodobacter lobularis]KMW58686.1 hypothetical protein AIOL_003665 [Candidatus Rhodobacter lobularis]
MRGLALLIATLLAPATQAAECQAARFDGAGFTWCVVDLEAEQMRLWLHDDAGTPFGSFDRLDQHLSQSGARLGIAMNAGMYHPDRAPVGLYVEQSKTLAPIVTRAGPGNFGMLPNGVLCLRDGGAAVMDSRAHAGTLDCRFATQSGPLLVIDGALHPRFLADSDSRHIRNGVGVRANGREVVLGISDEPVNFHHFARFFRDLAGTANALYLDGKVSKLYVPGLDRHDLGLPMGPIIGTVKPAG